MLDNEGQEMLDRDVVVVSALVNNSSSSQPGPSNLKTEVVFQDAAEAVKKMAATTGEPVSQPSSIGGDSKNDKKTTDSNICIIEKIPDLDLDLDERGGIIVGVDSILSSSPTKAVATALATVFSLSGGDILEDQGFGPIADASKGDDIGGGKMVESSAAALGAIWCDSGGGGGNRSGKEGGSDTVSEYLDAC